MSDEEHLTLLKVWSILQECKLSYYKLPEEIVTQLNSILDLVDQLIPKDPIV